MPNHYPPVSRLFQTNQPIRLALNQPISLKDVPACSLIPSPLSTSCASLVPRPTCMEGLGTRLQSCKFLKEFYNYHMDGPSALFITVNIYSMLLECVRVFEWGAYCVITFCTYCIKMYLANYNRSVIRLCLDE